MVKSTRDNMDEISIKDAFKDALISFTHTSRKLVSYTAAAWAPHICYMVIICWKHHRLHRGVDAGHSSETPKTYAQGLEAVWWMKPSGNVVTIVMG
jgi:hypothetical protein